MAECSPAFEKLLELWRERGTPAVSEEQWACLIRDTFAQLYAVPGRLLTEVDAVDDLVRCPDGTDHPARRASFRLIECAFVPVAQRLGLWETSRYLSDICFETLASNAEQRDARRLQQVTEQAVNACGPVVAEIEACLGSERLNAKVHVQRHSISSLVRRVKQGTSSLALPVYIAVTMPGPESDCYRGLAALHHEWQHIRSELRDYIGNPRDNGYRSIHTVVVPRDVALAEVHLQTSFHQMLNSGGMGALRRDPDLLSQISGPRPWFVPADADSQRAPRDDRVRVFTPAGEVVAIRRGSNILDFAFHVHTNLGNHYSSGRVNGAVVTMAHELNDGDLCEVEVNPGVAEPEGHWLDIATTADAKYQIRARLGRRLRTAQKIHELREQIRKRLEAKGVAASDETIDRQLWRIAQERRLESITALIDRMGEGKLSGDEIAWDIVSTPLLERLDPSSCELYPELRRDGRVKLAGCCKPAYGTRLLARLTRRNHLLSVHGATCEQIVGEAGFVPMAWRHDEERHSFYDIRIWAHDRAGLLADILKAIGAEPDSETGSANVSWLRMRTTPGASAEIWLSVSFVQGIAEQDLEQRLREVIGYRTCEVTPTATHNVSGPLVVRNPYRIGRGRANRRSAQRQSMFFGREHELKRLSDAMLTSDRPGSIAVHGPRRVGKTSLLTEFQERCLSQDQNRIVPVYVSAFELMVGQHSNVDVVVAEAIARAVHRALEEVSQVEADDIGIPPTPHGAISTLVDYLEGDVRQAARGARIVLCLDEFGVFVRWARDGALSEDFFRALYRLAAGKDNDYLGLVVAMPDTALDSWNAVTVRFDLEAVPIALAELDEQNARSLICDPVASLKYETEAVDFIVHQTQCHPWLIHNVCHEVVDWAIRHRAANITRSQAESIISDLCIRVGRSLFSVFYAAGDEDCCDIAGALARLSRSPEDQVHEATLATEMGLTRDHLRTRLLKVPSLARESQCNGKTHYGLRYPMVWTWARNLLA